MLHAVKAPYSVLFFPNDKIKRIDKCSVEFEFNLCLGRHAHLHYILEVGHKVWGR